MRAAAKRILEVLIRGKVMTIITSHMHRPDSACKRLMGVTRDIVLTAGTEVALPIPTVPVSLSGVDTSCESD